MGGTNQTDRAEALIARIEAETGEERTRIMAEAEAEAAAIVKAAHARARDRVHGEIEGLRRNRSEALRHETARLDTARRQLRQREARAEIEAGLPALEAAFAALWADGETRMAWVRAALAMARARFAPGAWTLEHPKTLTDEETAAIAKEIAEASGHAPELVADPDLVAGVRLRAGGAWIDATPGALMADREAVGAALLAEVAREMEDKQ